MDLEPLKVMVVEPVPTQREVVLDAVGGLGLAVSVARDFHEAKQTLQRDPPDLLITDIRLDAYNGLHLVLRARATRPDMAAIVTCQVADRVLQRDVEQLGATFVPTPASTKELTAAILRTAARPRGTLSWQPLRPPFERRTAEERRHHAAAPPYLERRSAHRRSMATPLIRPERRRR